MNRIFGPVPSRRLGRSLGVDLVPFKTCSYDCIYCQLGRTTVKTVERREWIPLEVLLDELKTRLSDAAPDYITLSGSGEPTLYSRLDELIAGIHVFTDVPVAVLTNGSLLWQPEVRRQLQDADLVIPSLDAGSPEVFEQINRPAPGITFERMLDGLIRFRQEFNKEYWLEIMVLEGVNSGAAAVEDLVRCAARIAPDRIQLNTAVRPPAEPDVAAVDPEKLARIARCFKPEAEVVADYRGVHAQPAFAGRQEQVRELLQRRPCTLEDIAAGIGVHQNEAVKYIGELKAEGRLEVSEVAGHLYYFVPDGPGREAE